jgi:hypothetical protein
LAWIFSDAGCYYVSTTVRSFPLASPRFQFLFEFDRFRGGGGVSLAQDAHAQTVKFGKKLITLARRVPPPPPGLGEPRACETIKFEKKLKPRPRTGRGAPHPPKRRQI